MNISANWIWSDDGDGRGYNLCSIFLYGEFSYFILEPFGLPGIAFQFGNHPHKEYVVNFFMATRILYLFIQFKLPAIFPVIMSALS